MRFSQIQRVTLTGSTAQTVKVKPGYTYGVLFQNGSTFNGGSVGLGAGHEDVGGETVTGYPLPNEIDSENNPLSVTTHGMVKVDTITGALVLTPAAVTSVKATICRLAKKPLL
jgi:hypothetical protein